MGRKVAQTKNKLQVVFAQLVHQYSLQPNIKKEAEKDIFVQKFVRHESTDAEAGFIVMKTRKEVTPTTEEPYGVESPFKQYLQISLHLSFPQHFPYSQQNLQEGQYHDKCLFIPFISFLY